MLMMRSEICITWSVKDITRECPPDRARPTLTWEDVIDSLISRPRRFCVPTLDVDPAWHTHLVKGETYQADCSTHIGRFVDRTPFPPGTYTNPTLASEVNENHLAAALDDTCRAWEVRPRPALSAARTDAPPQARFHTPCTSCGCPPPLRSAGAFARRPRAPATSRSPCRDARKRAQRGVRRCGRTTRA